MAVKRTLRLAAFVVWTVLSLWLFRVSTLHLDTLCSLELEPEYCRFTMQYQALFNLAYLYCFVLIGIDMLRPHFWRNMVMPLFAIFALNGGLAFVSQSTRNAMTYTYEWFYVLFGFWSALLFIGFLSGLMRQTRVRTNVPFMGIITIVFIVAAGILGRGSAGHVATLVGSAFSGITWEAILVSQLFWIFSGLCVLFLLMTIGRIVVKWIMTGHACVAHSWHHVKLLAAYTALLISSLLSLWVGWALHGHDVAEAQAYINLVEEAVVEHYIENGEYPKSVAGLEPGAERPRLIRRHDYVVDARASYYFSREDYYCFILHDPGPSFGYFSKTTKRGWRLSHYGQSIVDNYAEICEANNTEQDLVAEHLGLFGPDDPVAREQLNFDQVIRPALSSEASAKLKEKLEELQKTDPTIFEGTAFDARPVGQPGFTPEEAADFRARVPTEPLTEEQKRALDRESAQRLKRIQQLMEQLPDSVLREDTP